jgi:NTP pyrophosphatase (non-canonical NTP hydrolase)
MQYSAEDRNRRNFIYGNIESERFRQDKKWGDQSGNANVVWSTVLTEEVGEAAKAVLELDFGHGGTWEELREELIQSAAVCVAWIEAIDKREK